MASNPPPTPEFGKDTRISVSVDNGTTWLTIAGEKSFDFARASSDTDISDKDGPAKVFTPGVVTLAVSGNVKLPDAGLTAVYNAIKTGGVILAKAAKGSTARYNGPVTAGNWKGTFGQDGPVPYSFDLAAAGPATTDTLG
ncbi:putative secreted protein [Sphingomonas jinjuensis]|uniref:Putative secreted protein n=1 Tax=Sphingomonas jinjuensis TaxID=535907 RepID=A0A840F0T3_9SPHN|nr:hypothetical protein [Sphingomonas jinjuensis]MBB4152903.1 putative secreted protein [Sphingomonas jinjuensis]